MKSETVDCSAELEILQGKGCSKLLLAILRQAVDDAKYLTKKGIIQNGEIVVTKIPKSLNITIPEVHYLLNFFKDETLSILLSFIGVSVEPKIFRNKLNFNW